MHLLHLNLIICIHLMWKTLSRVLTIFQTEILMRKVDLQSFSMSEISLKNWQIDFSSQNFRVMQILIFYMVVRENKRFSSGFSLHHVEKFFTVPSQLRSIKKLKKPFPNETSQKVHSEKWTKLLKIVWNNSKKHPAVVGF